MESSKKTIEDYEDYLRAHVDLLHLTYTKNGGEEDKRTVNQLLKNVHRLTRYIEDLKSAVEHAMLKLPQEEAAVLKKLMEPLDEVISSKEELEVLKRNGD